MSILNLLRKLMSRKSFYEGEVVDLEENYKVSAEEAYDSVPCIFYNIYKHGTRIKLGSIDIRFKMDENMFYYGNIGYFIHSLHRGHSYAYWACLKVFEIAKREYHMNELIITCSPDNIASYKTLVKLNGQFLGVFDVPVDHELYRKNERVKCIFRYKL